MEISFVIENRVSKFPGIGGWHYVSVPKKYTLKLKERRKTWGMYPIIVKVGNTSWRTKLMMKKGGGFFVALNKEIRKIEDIVEGKIIKAKITLI